MQKLVLFVFFALTLLLRGQQTVNIGGYNTTFSGCSEPDRNVIAGLLQGIAPFDPVIFPRVPVIPRWQIQCTTSSAWGFNGGIEIMSPRVVPELIVFQNVLFHEFGHARGQASFVWPGMEMSATQVAAQLHTLTKTSSPDISGEMIVRRMVRKMGTFSQSPRQMEFTRDLDYSLATAPFLWVAAANGTGPAARWAESDMVGKIYIAIREHTIRNRRAIPADPEGLDETLDALENTFPATIDASPFGVWIRRFYRNVSTGAVTFEVTTWRNSEATAVNPNTVQLLGFKDEPAPPGGWPEMGYSLAALYPKRTFMNTNVPFLEVRDWTRKKVFDSQSTASGPIPIPPLPQGAYTAVLLDNYKVIQRSSFVIGNTDGGTVVIKKSRQGGVTEFGLNDRQTSGRIIWSGNGYAVVDPNCKSSRRCDLTVGASSGIRKWEQTFTMVTPFEEDQVSFMVEPPTPPRAR